MQVVLIYTMLLFDSFSLKGPADALVDSGLFVLCCCH